MLLLIVATEGSLTLQVPRGVTSFKAVVNPAHTFKVPVIPATTGKAFTVKVAEVLHPVASVYVIRLVPGPTAVTIPVVDPIIATDGVPLIQVPPPASVNVVVKPEHNDIVPEIADGCGLTVTPRVA